MVRSFWQGKCILITGGTSGLGLELVRFFLSSGCNVIATGRNPVQETFVNKNYTFLKVDFGNLENVASIARRLGDQSQKIDVIINNAGILSSPDYKRTIDGYEYTFQVNFLSHLLLDEIVLIKSKSCGLPLIVSVTSPVYRYTGRIPYICTKESEYKSFRSYVFSKIYLVFMGIYLSEKYKSDHLKCFSFNPGTFRSGIFRMQKNWFQEMYHIASPFMRNPAKVAQILAEIPEEQEIINGAIYRGKNKFKKLESIDKQTIENFMKQCYGYIESYFR